MILVKCNRGRKVRNFERRIRIREDDFKKWSEKSRTKQLCGVVKWRFLYSSKC
jgi:hypothetical protein